MGKIRRNNEDNLLFGGRYMRPKEASAPFHQTQTLRVPCLLAVCDGMGGHENGERASFLAVSTLARHHRQIAAGPSPEQAALEMERCVEEINRQLVREMQAQAIRMGTTLAAAVVTGHGIQAYNIGDSRVYLYQNQALSQLSKDHTPAAQKVQMGILTPAAARTDPDRHKLTRFLGVAQEEFAGALEAAPPVPAEGFCRLLLCSDGVSDMLEDPQIAEILGKATDAEKAAEALIQAALEAGGRDNATCIVADIGPGRKAATGKPGKTRHTGLIVALCALALGILAACALWLGGVSPFTPRVTPEPAEIRETANTQTEPLNKTSISTPANTPAAAITETLVEIRTALPTASTLTPAPTLTPVPTPTFTPTPGPASR